MKKIFFLIMNLLLLHIVRAQTTIQGTVADSLNDMPVSGAVIRAFPAAGQAMTDNNGRFILHTKTKTDSITISCMGYVSQSTRSMNDVLHIRLRQAPLDINAVVVSASREAQARTDAPVAISTISKNTIEATKATQLDQLLNQAAGVYMVDLGNQQHAMAIRQPLGYNNYFLYLEDGIPIRTGGDFNHNALIEINDAALERIEMVKGPASALYGSQAVGGAVNFITQRPSLSPTAKVELEKGSYGYIRANMVASTTIKKLGLYIGGYYANRDVPESQHNDFHKLALNFRADYSFNDRTQLTFAVAKINYYTDQKGGLDSAQFFSRGYEKDPFSNQRFTYRKVDALRARATLEHSWNDNSRTGFTLYYRDNAVGQNPFYRESTPVNNVATGEVNEDAFQSYGAIISHVQQFSWLHAKWISGISADVSPETYRAQAIAINVNPEVIYENYTTTDSFISHYKADLYNTAAYTQFEITPLEKFKITAGLRYDRLDYKFTNALPPSAATGPADTVNHYAHFTPRIGALYNFGKGKGIYANYSVGFAPPDITSLYDGYVVPDLKPSTFYNYEVGGWLAFADKGYAEVSLYKMYGVNEIVSVVQPNGISLNENAGRTTHTGAEISIRYQPLPDLLLKLSGTYVQHKYKKFTDGKTNVDNNIMADAPPYIVNAWVTYKPHYFMNFTVAGEWQSVAPYYSDAENKHQYPGYNIFNLRASWKFRGFEIWANCLNVTNKVYATIVTYGYGRDTYYPGMLRTFNIGMGYTFRK